MVIRAGGWWEEKTKWEKQETERSHSVCVLEDFGISELQLLVRTKVQAKNLLLRKTDGTKEREVR